MATSTMNTFLMKGTKAGETITWTKLVDIKDFPDLQGEPNMLPTTTLSDEEETNITGIKKSESKPFTCNYDKTAYEELVALEGVNGHYAVFFGEDGAAGKFAGEGMPSIMVTGKGVDEVREMKITFAMSKGFKLVA